MERHGSKKAESRLKQKSINLNGQKFWD